MRHPHAGQGPLPGRRRLLADRAGPRADDRADRRGTGRARAGDDRRAFHPRCAVRRLFGPVLHQPRPYRAQRQPWRLLAGLPSAVHAARRGGAGRRLRQAPAVDEGQQPERQPRGLDRRRRAQFQDRGSIQGDGLRQEHYRSLPAASRRHSRAPPRIGGRRQRSHPARLCPGPGQELPPRRDRLLRPRPRRRCRRLRFADLRRHAARHGDPDRGGLVRAVGDRAARQWRWAQLRAQACSGRPAGQSGRADRRSGTATLAGVAQRAHQAAGRTAARRGDPAQPRSCVGAGAGGSLGRAADPGVGRTRRRHRRADAEPAGRRRDSRRRPGGARAPATARRDRSPRRAARLPESLRHDGLRSAGPVAEMPACLVRAGLGGQPSSPRRRDGPDRRPSGSLCARAAPSADRTASRLPGRYPLLSRQCLQPGGPCLLRPARGPAGRGRL